MTLPGGRHYTVELHVSAERVPQIRRIVAAHLRHWDLAPQIPPVCEGVAELLTNVHRHVGAEARCVVELRWSGRQLTASVTDDGPQLPRLDSAAGGGLARIAALSDSWGTCATAGGKVIWFTRRVEAPRTAPAAPPVRPRGVPDAGEPASAADGPLPAPTADGPVPAAGTAVEPAAGPAPAV
ncbi:ATP-binding protein [Streptomyces sp. RS10V-4]|uniref:ATP-binding protein n=1 Tax=Streptomyces rhizoryzae TaxID=2932493 RepID=UPI0020047BC0|nr:ATP-binding protein [Streptomyces rhizoryzae]MCK7625523.1 ATP-binding protein [Streptomyces rhizoryzae]